MVSLELIDPGGNAGNVQIKHKDKGAEDLGLVLGGAARGRIKRGHELHDVVKVEKPEFFPGGGKLRAEPEPEGRIEMDLSLMQEGKIFLMGLPV